MGIADAVFYTKEVESLCMKLSAPYESWTCVVRGGMTITQHTSYQNF